MSPCAPSCMMAHCPVEGLDSVKGASVHSRLNFSRWGRSLWDGVRHTERLGTPSLVRTQAAKSVSHATPFRAPHVHAPPGNALSLILQAFGRAMGGVGGGISRGSMNLGPGGRECHSELPPPRPWSGPSPLLPHLVVVETLLGWVAPPLPFSSGRHGGVGKGAE